MNADDLQAELDRLWARVNSDPSVGDPPPGPAFGDIPLPTTDPGSPTREASLEVISLLKRQRFEETSRLQEMLTLKERAVHDLSERLRAAQLELIELKRAEQRKDRHVLSEVLEVSVKLEDANRSMKEQEHRFAEEERVLRDIAEKTRQQLASETARWRELERQWNQREQQYLLDLKEAQTSLARAQEDAGKHEQKSVKLSDDMKQAKGAIEATLSELLAERRQREGADQEREKALKRVSEVEAHFQELQKIWEEERKQWQELWDRERSTWETQRRELASWEERLRKEREAWHADLRKKEEAELRFASRMTETLRESSEASAQMAKTVKTLAVETGAAPAPRRSLPAWVPAAGVALVALALAAYPVWVRMNRLQLTPLASHALPLDNPTALAYDGAALWVAEWSGRLASVDPSNPAVVLSRHPFAGPGSYHPAALALGGDFLWSIDTAQGRILKHALRDPGVAQAAWPSPGPAPVALAHDGRHLWSYDAVTKSLYRHDGEGAQAEVATFSLAADVVPTSLNWVRDELWLHDSKSKRLLRLRRDGNAFDVRDGVPADPSVLSVGMFPAAKGRTVWTLRSPSSDSPGYGLKKYLLQP